MTFMQWLLRRLGTAIDIDGAYGAQCVDAVNGYLAEVCRAAGVTGDAVDIARQHINGFAWRVNADDNAPRPGSVVVWNANVGELGIGQYGHTAIAVFADRYGLITADQNWGGVRALTLTRHTYRGVAGWHYPTA